jgi:hypothetical protein
LKAPLSNRPVDQTQTKEARYAAPGAVGTASLATRTVPRGLLARAQGAVTDWFKTAAITLGAMYVIGWFVLTLGVAWMGRVNSGLARFDNTMEKQYIADVMRPYALPADASISMDEAGRAFLALQPPSQRTSGGFTLKAPAGASPEVPWRGMVLAPELFPEARNSSYEGPGQPVIDASKRGFSPKERAVLKLIATAPHWRDWDIVARAPKLDVIGSRMQVPFAPNAAIYLMPTMRFAASKEFGYAAVSRAAWHLSEGRRDSAEWVLRAIVSQGFALSDNATSAVDQLIGNVVVGIGRDALVRYYALTKDSRGPAIEAAAERARKRPGPAAAQVSVRDYNARVVAVNEAIEAPELGRGIRMEMIGQRARVACGDARELVFGYRPETQAVFDKARAELGRYASERAVIDLYQDAMKTPVSAWTGGPSAVSALDALGRIYFNPRLATCAVFGFGARLF